jgi:hypothetical protein
MHNNTGGPAFPVVYDHSKADVRQVYGGMTLRDYFAAKAMQGLMGRVWGEQNDDELIRTWANSAYLMADAMLKAREA